MPAATEKRRECANVNKNCYIRFSGIRRLNLERFPYGIFYIVKPEEVRVLAVLHGRRETKNILAGRRRTFSQF
jgi:plasmid stabilization system protein ParE